MSDPAQTLREFIDKAKTKQGVTSANALARRARDAGYAVSHTTFSSITAGTYPSRPSKATLEAIAGLAGVSYAEVYRAAGLGETGPPFTDQLPRNVDNLTASQRNVVLMMIRALLDASGGEDSAPSPEEQEELPPPPMKLSRQIARRALVKDITKKAAREEILAEKASSAAPCPPPGS